MGNPRRLPALERIEATRERLSKGGGRRSWSERQEAAQQNALEAITAPFNIFKWIKNNWQASIIIVICLMILTR